MTGWQRVFFGDVPDVPRDYRFFNEVIETGDMLWSDFASIGTTRYGDECTKTMEWAKFRVAGAEMRLKMYQRWNSRIMSGRRVDFEMVCEHAIAGHFRLSLAFAVWDPTNVQRFITSQTHFVDFKFKKHHEVGFRGAIPVDGHGMPTVGIFDGTLRSNVAMYVRLELPNTTVYPLRPATPQHVALVPGPGQVYEMENTGNEQQDSTVFELGGARWRIFYMKKPDPMLLLQRLPAINIHEEAGTIEADFDLLGVQKNGNWVKENLQHKFEPGFSDWGERNPKFKKANHFVLRLHILSVGSDSGYRVPGLELPVGMAAPASSDGYRPPDGPPPGAAGPPLGPPPGAPPGAWTAPEKGVPPPYTH